MQDIIYSTDLTASCVNNYNDGVFLIKTINLIYRHMRANVTSLA